MYRKIVCITLIILSSLTVAASSDDAIKDTDSNVIEPIIVFGIENNFPFSYQLDDGTKTGLYIDMWRLWSDVNDVAIEFRLTDFKQALDEMQTIRAIHSGLFKTDERAEWANFSMPIHHIRTGVLVQTSTNRAATLSEFMSHKVAVFSDTFQAQLLRDKYPELSLVLVSDTDTAVEKLRSGEVKALIGEVPFLEGILQQRALQGVLHLTEEVLATDQIHALTSKQFPKLQDLVNEGFDNIPVRELVALEKQWMPTHEPFFKKLVNFSELTLSEKKWLQSHNDFSRGADIYWSPFEYLSKQGDIVGIASDYLELIEAKLDVRFETNKQYDWNEALQAMKSGEVDIMSAIIRTPEREQFLNFTQPYFTTPTVIVTRKDTFFVGSMSHLNGKKVGLIKGYALSELIASDYPQIEIVDVDSIAEALAKVESREIDATINASPVINSAIDKYGTSNLIIAAASPYKFEVSMAVRKELQPLVPILNKAITSITDKERTMIANAWLPIQIDNNEQLKVIFVWLVPVLAILLIIIIYISGINSKLNTEISNRKRTENERLELEKQLHQSQKMEALGKLTGGIAHDFNNMLGIIMGYSELLNKADVPDMKLAHYAAQIHAAGERGVNLTTKLLSLTKNRSVNATEVDVNDVIRAQQDVLQKSLTVRINIELELASNLWSIRIDNSDLDDAILNLCINAMHAMEDITSQAVLTIRTQNIVFNQVVAKQHYLEQGEYVKLSILDNGCGMSDSVRQQIFDPFFTTKGEMGSGLGLSQVFGFVKRSAGSIIVTSEEGQGTSFDLYFPRYIGENEQSDTITTPDTEKLTGTESILIIDDEPALRTLVTEILTEQGYQCLQASNGREGLEMINNEPVDMVISDIIMPELDGIRLAGLLKENFPDVKILLVSGYTEVDGAEHTPDEYYENLIVKPFASNELLRRVRQILDS